MQRRVIERIYTRTAVVIIPTVLLLCAAALRAVRSRDGRTQALVVMAELIFSPLKGRGGRGLPSKSVTIVAGRHYVAVLIEGIRRLIPSIKAFASD
jgi:hypothetical protein